MGAGRGGYGIRPAGVDDETVEKTFVANLKYAADKLQAAGIKLVMEMINTRDIPGFYLNPTRITNAVQMLEQEAIVDLPGSRLVAPWVVRQLDVVDLFQVRGHGARQVAFHDLHVVDVVLQEQVVAADLLANRQGLRRVVDRKSVV